MPVGPHILWLEATIQSAPRRCTSSGMLGTLWQQSSNTRAPTCWRGRSIYIGMQNHAVWCIRDSGSWCRDSRNQLLAARLHIHMHAA